MVSVIIIFLNAGRFVAEAIDSVLAQGHTDWELLLVDDGSSDDGSTIARDYASRMPDKVRYFEHTGHVNRGMSASRNVGITHARGEYIAFLDADDIWKANKLERQLAILQRHPEVGMVYGSPEYIGAWETPEQTGVEHRPLASVASLDAVFQPPVLATLLYPLGDVEAPAPSDLLLRRSAVERAGGFEETFPGFYEDQAFLLKVYLREPVFVSSESWLRYRIHPESCSSVTMHSGRYHTMRRYFLNWLGVYLHHQGVSDHSVWNALGVALAASGQQLREEKWSLRAEGANRADVSFPVEPLDAVRVDIAQASTTVDHDVQLNRGRLQVRAKRRYVAEFDVRADAPRSITAGVAEVNAPWEGLGWYRHLDLTTEWQHHAGEFVATKDADEARIHFNLGGNATAIELSAVRLRPLDDTSSGGSR